MSNKYTIIKAYGLETRTWMLDPKKGYGCAECCNGDRCDEDCDAKYKGNRKNCPHCKGHGWIPESDVESPDAVSGLDAEDIEQIEQALELKMYNIEMAHLQQLLRMLYSKVKGQAPQPDKEAIKAAAIDHVKTVGGNDACYDSFIAGYEYAASRGSGVGKLIKQVAECAFNSRVQIEGSAGFEPWWEEELKMNKQLRELMSEVQNVQVSDTTGADSSNAADYKKQLEDSLLLYNNQTATIEKLQEKLKEKEDEIVKLKKELDGWARYKQNIDEALNSGDGTYRP